MFAAGFLKNIVVRQDLDSEFVTHSLTHAHYAVWHVGRLRRIATSVGSGLATGWYSKCVAWS